MRGVRAVAAGQAPAPRHQAAMALTDRRIALTQQALLGIKLVKFGGQEQVCETRVGDVRRRGGRSGASEC